MQRREFLRNGLLLGSVGLLPGFGFAANQFLDCSKPDIKLLFQAIEEGNVDVVKSLIRKGVDVNAADDCWTSLHYAAQCNDTEIIRILVAEGANVNAIGGDSTTPLHWVMLYRNSKGIKLLVSNGADVNIALDDGTTPLHIAVALSSANVVTDMTVLKLLIENGADVNAKTDDGDTPLHKAAAWRSIEMVEFLVLNGADTHVQDIYGVTPLDLAMIRFEDEKTKENAAVFEYLSDVANCQNMLSHT